MWEIHIRTNRGQTAGKIPISRDKHCQNIFKERAVHKAKWEDIKGKRQERLRSVRKH